MDKVIEVKNLYFSFSEQIVLDNISFDVNKGSFIGVIGSNGAGKSTLLKILLKQLPFSGSIKLMGQDIAKFNQWDKIGYVSQKANSFNQDFPATVEEVVGCNLYSKIGFAKFISKKQKELVYASLEKVGMKDYSKRLIGNLSGGQQQRVFIARSLVCDPEILLLDEPTVGIDAKAENTVYCLLKELNIDLGITILMITHDLGAITVHADRIFALGENGLHEYDPKETLDSDFFRQIYGIDLTKHVHYTNSI